MEKYQYLISSLSGEALNVVTNLQFTAEHYPIAYDLLIERYQKKRRLATHYWHALVQAKPLKADSSQSLRQLMDTFNENTRALALMQFPVESCDFILLNALLDKFTQTLRERFEAEHRKTEIPTYSQLAKFLSEYCRVFASISDASISPVKSPNRNPKSKASVSFVTNVDSCPVCQEQHLVTKCSRFLKLSPKKRHLKANELDLCLNCLRLGHGVKSCTSTWRCRSCKSSHHTLLHFERDTSPTGVHAAAGATANVESESKVSQSQENSVVPMTSVSTAVSTVLLSTVRAEALDISGHPFPVRILLNSASQ